MGKIVSFDLDMTLLDHNNDSTITQSALDAIEKIRGEHKIVIASGRDMTLPSNRVYVEQIKPDAIIHANGAKVEVENQIIYKNKIPGDIVKVLAKKAEELDCCIGSMRDGTYYCINEERVIELETELFGECKRKLAPLSELFGDDIYTMSSFDDEEGIIKLEREFPMLRFPRFSITYGADIIQGDLSKEVGMGKLLDYWQGDFFDVIAFGDSLNDYELIKRAGIGIAMGNAVQQLKDAADYVTDSIENNGVRKALHYFGIL